jgi:hypothetical protein
MSYTLIIKDGAHKDAVDAYEHYEEQQAGLGERFLISLATRYQDISLHPEYYSFIIEDSRQILRDVLLEAFPYTVVFEIMNKYIIFYAIHNTYHHPDKKLNRI